MGLFTNEHIALTTKGAINGRGGRPVTVTDPCKALEDSNSTLKHKNPISAPVLARAKSTGAYGPVLMLAVSGLSDEWRKEEALPKSPLLCDSKRDI